MTQGITKVHIRNGAAVAALSGAVLFLNAVADQLTGTGLDIDHVSTLFPLIATGVAAVVGLGQHQAIQADDVRAAAEVRHAGLAVDVADLKAIVPELQTVIADIQSDQQQQSPTPPG